MIKKLFFQLKRRSDFFTATLVCCALIASTAIFLTFALLSQRVFSASVLPYVDPMPILSHILVQPGQTDITIHLNQFTQVLNSGFTNPTVMWGYNGSSPGPVIDVESNQFVRVHWQNDLPTTHIFASPSDAMNSGPLPGDTVVLSPAHLSLQPSVAAAGFMNLVINLVASSLPDVRNITHLHGAFVSMNDPMNRQLNSDGWPDAWNLPGAEQIAEYPNPQDARTLFFHDHAVGTTGRNVAAGLVGVYLIHDNFERSLNLPSGDYDIPMVFTSLGWHADGSRYYSTRVDNEFFGNGVLVNGKYVPYLAVEPRKYRFRMINADNARAFGFSLVNAAKQSEPGPAFYQIGSDAGFLAQTVVMSDLTDSNSPQLQLIPAERADVIVDFSKFAGETLMLLNTNSITDPDGELPITNIMQFKVAAQVKTPDTSSLPTTIRAIARLNPASAVKIRQIVLSQQDQPDGSTLFSLNHRSWITPKTDNKGLPFWDYQITDQVLANTMEEWDLVNTSILPHPFHVHDVQFQILDRRPFDVDHFNETGEIVYTGDAVPPGINEMGWKDVVRSDRRFVTRIVMKFGSTTGYYVYHCHILEHEDMDMMTPFQIVPASGQ